MAEQRQDNQLEPTYSSSVLIQDVALKTYQKQWMIGKGGERGSGISVLIARHDDEIPPLELSTLVKELMATTCVMQSSSNKLNTLVSESAKCKQTKSYIYVLNSRVEDKLPNG